MFTQSREVHVRWDWFVCFCIPYSWLRIRDIIKRNSIVELWKSNRSLKFYELKFCKTCFIKVMMNFK